MPTLPSRPPKTVTIGTGSDVLTLKVCQDWYPTVDASYNVKVDGVQVGATQTVSALRANGQWDTVHVLGNWTSTTHTCTVNFLNNAGDGYDWITNNQPADFHDRNMYVYGEMINNKIITGANLNLMTGGTGEVHTFNFTRAAPVVVPTKTPANTTVGTGPDSLVLHAAQDWYPGANAQFTVSVDGTQIGGTIITQSLKSANQTDTITVLGNFASGNHTVSINFINNAGDGYDWITFGEPANLHDRNLYISNVTFNGAAVSGSDLSLLTGAETHTFTITKAGGIPNNPPKSVTLGTGADAIVFHISQDWYQAAASYNVTLDGVQIGANQTVSSIQSTGNFDTVTVHADLASGSHTLSVNFLNDAWDGVQDPPVYDGHDRNIYVSATTFNGVSVQTGTLFMTDANSPHTVTFSKAASGGGGGSPPPNYPVALTNAGITGATLTFSDEFDTLDIAGDGSQKWRSDGDANAYSVSGGILTLAQNGNLRSDGGYPNGFIQRYGYFSARMVLPSGTGAWPGFYLSGQGGSDYELEIDQLEGGSNTFAYAASFNVWKAPDYGSVPWEQAPWNVDPQGTTWDTTEVTSSVDLAADYHIYAVLWKPGSGGGHDITFYLDDQIVAHQTVAASLGDSGPGDEIVLQNFNNANSTNTPLLIDWVRVWQLP